MIILTSNPDSGRNLGTCLCLVETLGNVANIPLLRSCSHEIIPEMTRKPGQLEWQTRTGERNSLPSTQTWNCWCNSTFCGKMSIHDANWKCASIILLMQKYDKVIYHWKLEVLKARLMELAGLGSYFRAVHNIRNSDTYMPVEVAFWLSVLGGKTNIFLTILYIVGREMCKRMHLRIFYYLERWRSAAWSACRIRAVLPFMGMCLILVTSPLKKKTTRVSFFSNWD